MTPHLTVTFLTMPGAWAFRTICASPSLCCSVAGRFANDDPAVLLEIATLSLAEHLKNTETLKRLRRLALRDEPIVSLVSPASPSALLKIVRAIFRRSNAGFYGKQGPADPTLQPLIEAVLAAHTPRPDSDTEMRYIADWTERLAIEQNAA